MEQNLYQYKLFQLPVRAYNEETSATQSNNTIYLLWWIKAQKTREAGGLDLEKILISPMLNLKKGQSSTIQHGSFWNWSDIMSYMCTPDKGPSFFDVHSS